MEGKTCNGLWHKGLGGWMIAVFGLAFLLQNLQIITPALASIVWPCAVILFGLEKSCSCHGMTK